MSLKDNTHEFTGNYSLDGSEITNLTSLPPEKVMEYNLTDCCATNYLKKKNWPVMVNDQQEGVYNTIFKPAVKNLLQMELTGLPLIMENVKYAEKVLTEKLTESVKAFNAFPEVKKALKDIRIAKYKKRNLELKRKHISLNDPEFTSIEFNPNSDDQVRYLLYEVMGCEVIDLTENKQPATGNKNT